MLDKDRTYMVKINDKEYEFTLRNFEEIVQLEILDAGGLADAFPKHMEQYEWIEPRLAKIQGVKHTWSTVWQIQTESALKKVINLLEDNGYNW